MTSEKVVTPIGFLEASITVDDDTPINSLIFIKSSLRITGTVGALRDSIPVRIGEPQMFPLLPGTYHIYAIFGNVRSKPSTIVIEQGKTSTVEFYFGT